MVFSLTPRAAWMMGLSLGLLFAASLLFQAWQLYRFVHQGARFTAADGQALCQRVQALERHSYGYRDAGQAPLSCDYGLHDR